MSLTNKDSYKKSRELHKKEQKRKKLVYRLQKLAALVVLALVVVWIGWSAYAKIEEGKPRAGVTVDYTAFDDYLQGLTAEE